MMLPYLDPIAGLQDPDPLGDWTLSEFVEYVCCLRKTLSKEEFHLGMDPSMMTFPVRASGAPLPKYRSLQGANWLKS